MCFFFFKQKTAYEIYQCDWSSDVCSSDLAFLWRSSATRRREMAAGVTPAILEACPTEEGRTFWSFSATSFENPLIL